MKAYFHPSQDLHVPKTYFTRGQMRQPQEVPARTGHLLEGLRELGMPVLQPADQGAGPISRVHDLGYLRFLQTAHRRWMEMEDWGDEVMSNIFVRSPNAMRGILAGMRRGVMSSCSTNTVGSSASGIHDVTIGTPLVSAVCSSIKTQGRINTPFSDMVQQISQI